jgi:hypothetical protein
VFSATVQTDTGQSVPLTRPDGTFAGKTLLTFMMSVLSRCNDALQPAERALCAACFGLMKAAITSLWSYCEGEDYQSYVTRTGDYDLGEDAFLRAAVHYEAAWTDIHTLIALTQMAIVQMEMAPPVGEPDRSYNLALVDFRALYTALDAALAHGAARARLDIH